MREQSEQVKAYLEELIEISKKHGLCMQTDTRHCYLRVREWGNKYDELDILHAEDLTNIKGP